MWLQVCLTVAMMWCACVVAPCVSFAQDDEADAKAMTAAEGQFKEIALAILNHENAVKRFPPPAIVDKAGQPLLSWRVAILPYLEQLPLYKEFRLNEPWDSPHNLALVKKMPSVYAHPKSKLNENGCTVYQVPRGDATLFPPGAGVQMRQITDGLSKTIMLVEVDDQHAVPWTSPDDWKLEPGEPAAGLGGHFLGSFMCLGADGAVHSLPVSINKLELNALFTRAGREAVAFP